MCFSDLLTKTDSKNALYIYIVPPKLVGLRDMRKYQVLKLKRSLYSFKDAAKIWYKTITEKLESYDLTEIRLHHAYFVKKKSFYKNHIDGFLIFFKKENTVNDVKTKLSTSFFPKHLDSSKQFLGSNIDWTYAHEIRVSQITLFEKVLSKHNMSTAKPMNWSVHGTSALEVDEKDVLPNDKRNYQSTIGGFLYLALQNGPKMFISSSNLGTFVENTQTAHIRGAK